jgi:hypothetical protein
VAPFRPKTDFLNSSSPKNNGKNQQEYNNKPEPRVYKQVSYRVIGYFTKQGIQCYYQPLIYFTPQEADVLGAEKIL